MPRLKTSGFNHIWEMREFMGHDSNGNRVTREVFKNMKTGETYVPLDKSGNFLGWNGEPTGAKPDQPVFSASDRYRQNFDLISWSK